MSDKFTVLIVGAGRIGAFFDRPGSDDVLTHAHAFSGHKSFRLLGFVDPLYDQAKEAARLWGGAAYETMEQALSSNAVDVLVNASPDQAHFEILKQSLAARVKLIFTEKPLASTFDEAREIFALAELGKVPVAINYSRCFVPSFAGLKADIASGLYGDYLTGTGYYGKGLLHNGSHLINLLEFLLGPIASIETTQRTNDYSNSDPSYSGVLYFKSGQNFFMQTVDSRLFTIFELDLVFSKTRIRIINSGFQIEFYCVVDDARFTNYQTLSLQRTENTELAHSLSYAADNIANYLQGTGVLACSLADGYRAMEIISKIS